MLSYLHSYHAGNFADVLKHSVSTHILNYLCEKPRPFFYLDTHAGTGAFELSKKESQQNQEYLNGIAKLWKTTQKGEKQPGLVSNYLDLIAKFNPTDKLSHYPGSPWFAQEIMREHDRLSLFELHPREFKSLANNFKHDRRIKAVNSDGFHACLSQLPPKEKRGYILMDPPYEVKDDYQTVVNTIIKAHKKFATGTYALWYPMVHRHRIRTLEKSFIKSGIKNIQLFELGIEADGENGMTASGMIVINPPWTLKAEMKTALPYFAKMLEPNKSHFRIEQLSAE